MTELPAGTVTFLFTDVEGSTKLLHELGAERYAQALAEHRRIVREACAECGGVEVDTQGDAFFLAFPTAQGALRAAHQIGDGLQPGRIRLRMGLHTGTPLLTEEGYVGEDVHFAARIAASAHGGQVVLSQATRDLLDDQLTDLGEHRLKDIEQAVAIFQLGDETFPPLKTISNTNLPRPASSFVGRERELTEVLARIEQGARLLTLTGPGGSGKTRLALEAAATLVPEYRAGVFWVALAALRDPALVTEQIAQTLGAKDGLAEHIGERELCLLLDNLEQVIEAAPDVSAILGACPNLTLLVTSRELLRVQGEVEYPVPPLAEPEAVSLFCERARLEPSKDIAELCARLDSLPLAVELAAARTRALSPAQILERLSQRLDLFKGGRDADPRQQTLRATIEWSYDLLSEEEQRLFRALSVFSGGCTPEAAEDVTGAVLDTLQSLVEKSLLRFSNGRYWMLETIREFAAEHLENDADRDQLEMQHARHYCRLSERAEPELTGRAQPGWLRALANDYENLRAAILFAAVEDPSTALRIGAALPIFWYVRGLYREGARWLERVLASATGEPLSRRKAVWGLGLMRVLSGDLAGAKTPLEESLGLARVAGDDSTAARALDVLGLGAFFADDIAGARRLFEESVELARRAQDSWCLADALGTLASIYPLQGEFEIAAASGREGLAIARQNGDEHGMRMALFGLALAAERQGRHDAARGLAGEGLAIARELEDRWFASYFLWILAGAALASGDTHRARVEADESVDLAYEIDSPLLLSCALEVRARAAKTDGDCQAAKRDLDSATDAVARGGVPKSYVAALLLTRGELARGDGAPGEARDLMERSKALAEEVGDRWAAERAAAALATID